MALTKRWSNLPEQADSLFPFFGCAFLAVSGFACAPWQTKQYETAWIAKHHLQVLCKMEEVGEEGLSSLALHLAATNS